MSGITVAFIGPDGAGKSTVTRQVVERFGRRGRRIYMGVNLDEANVALPTTKLLLRLKERRGGRPDMTGWPTADKAATNASLRDVVRILNLIAEEWFRAAIAAYHKFRGRVVIMDRHFIADYWKHDIAPDARGKRSWISRLHGFLLGKVYPRPDHMIFLDASPELLYERKSEATLEFLEVRRSEYVDLEKAMGSVTRVVSDRPLDQVVHECVEIIKALAP